MRFEVWHAFVLGAVLSWGTYVPLLHQGQVQLGEGKPGAGSVRAFLCVGIAYFITAVVIPLLLLYFNAAGGEGFSFHRKDGTFNTGGVAFATVAGVAGAAGALCIILSMKSGGTPLFVPPLVFAGAPIVNVIVSILWHPPKGGAPDWMFFAGIVLAAVGAGMVLYSKAQLDARGRYTPPAAAKTEPQALVQPPFNTTPSTQ